MTCPRCLPNRPCLNHELEAARIACLKAKDKAEAIAIGRARYERNSREVRGWR